MRVTNFDPETINDMQVALDLAWKILSSDQKTQSSKIELATRILDAAALGERSTSRLVRLALMETIDP